MLEDDHSSVSSRPPAVQRLSPQLWDLILGELRPKDLNSLYRTSSHFSTLIRGILYRTLTLDARIRPLLLEPTLKLLQSDPILAACVRHLTIWVSLNILHPYFLGIIKNMVSLQTLRILGAGSIFVDAEEQNRFVKHISSLETPLEEFEIALGTDHGVELCTEYLPISGLRKLSFQLYGRDYETGIYPMWNLLESSHETLESLVIRSFDLRAWDNWAMNLFTTRFPRLKSITISRAENLNWRAFPEFLAAHSATLEELNLAVTYESLASCGRFWKSDLLPSLRSFGGPVRCFQDMIHARMGCLWSLRSLDLVGVDDSHRNIGPKMEQASGLLHQLREWQATSQHGIGAAPILGLTELKLDLRYYNSTSEDENMDFCPECYYSADASDKCLFQQKPHKHVEIPPGCQGTLFVQEVLDVLGCFAQICGRTLEVWKGVINFPIDRDRLVAAFGQFVRLKVVHISLLTILTNVRGFALALAAKCPALEEVIVADRNDMYFLSIKIGRNGGGPRITWMDKGKFE